MKITIEIECDNAAFYGPDGEASDGALGDEIGRICADLAERVSVAPGRVWNLHDANGNWVGKAIMG